LPPGKIYNPAYPLKGMDPYVRSRMQRKLDASVSAVKKHKETITFQELKLIEMRRRLERTKLLLQEANARCLACQNLLDE